jgi:hypothetical protein
MRRAEEEPIASPSFCGPARSIFMITVVEQVRPLAETSAQPRFAD